ncbi:hypothetical protein [Promicromonospora iranensis]|uniref:Uncharacterized protein n=1 Tax=Promicromonospora iranensis TaxID=1105144 RepID=A0ABU2CWN9_9MICO|nr:hypothetical protein [Promicromonospora iranensis]MDR7385681.1 hypothetical protein [Promicromonospora iranensis]
MNLDDIEIESHDTGDGHCEVTLMWAIEWPDEPLPSELLDGDVAARPVWVARRKAAGRLARVLAASLDDLDATRARHGCGPLYYDHHTPGCHAWAPPEVLLPCSGDWGNSPMVSVHVPPAEAKAWVARLTERLQAVCADDQAMPDAGHTADAEPRLLRTTTDRAKETP